MSDVNYRRDGKKYNTRRNKHEYRHSTNSKDKKTSHQEQRRMINAVLVNGSNKKFRGGTHAGGTCYRYDLRIKGVKSISDSLVSMEDK